MTNLDFDVFADLFPAPKRRKRRTRARFMLVWVYPRGSAETDGTKRDLEATMRAEAARPKQTATRIELWRNGDVIATWHAPADEPDDEPDREPGGNGGPFHLDPADAFDEMGRPV